ncbi:hypothetical protein BD410DRAFT_842263 [Rickenella mellea]|uniref:Uncharacterized protein n=1 Tax=Rickenella mellea TaxID=50990 RepID=A0A4Y7PVT3_9AGAM|nr:hypothetical protein BD410DRAFT_842263 [Rickenella mellea]
MLKAGSSRTVIARPIPGGLRRSFATVQDPPVRLYGGLKDQDRIFTNAHSRHDFSLKGAKSRGNVRRTSSEKATRGSSTPSEHPAGKVTLAHDNSSTLTKARSCPLHLLILFPIGIVDVTQFKTSTSASSASAVFGAWKLGALNGKKVTCAVGLARTAKARHVAY